MSFIDTALTAATAILGDAAAPYALFTQNGRMIGTIAVDVPLREVHDDTFVLTQHPVEGGTPVADHYFANPKAVEMSCGYSDSTAGYVGYVQAVYQSFIALALTREPFDVSTGKRQYSNMMIVDLAVVTDPTSEYALFITVRLQEVIISTTGDTSSTGATNDNQAQPQQTGPETNVGAQTAGPLPYFAAGAPAAAPVPVGSGASGSLPFFATGAAP